MSDRLSVILASGDPRVLEMGLMYARNVVKHGWMREVKLFLFGPAEVQIATDPALQEAVRAIVDEGTVPMACKFCSDKFSVSGLLSELGCAIEYVGDPISRSIRDGFVPMVW